MNAIFKEWIEVANAEEDEVEVADYATMVARGIQNMLHMEERKILSF